MKTSTAIKLPYNSEYKSRAYTESQAFFGGFTQRGGWGVGGLYTEPLLHLLFVSQERVME